MKMPIKSKKIEATAKEIEDFMKRHKVSGIFHISGIGCVTLFNDFATRLRVLDWAQIELVSEQMRKEEQAKMLLKSKIINTSDMPIELEDKRRGYIG